MTTDEYIKKHKTSTFKKGDNVVMHSCGEANFPENKGVIWLCLTDSFLSRGDSELIFLENFSGSFLTKYLQIIKI